MPKSDMFALMGAAARKATNNNSAIFIKKLSVDIDQEHLDIIERRQRMSGVHSGMRGVIWEALDLLAKKYDLTDDK